jgi:hypothetical protein
MFMEDLKISSPGLGDESAHFGGACDLFYEGVGSATSLAYSTREWSFQAGRNSPVSINRHLRIMRSSSIHARIPAVE